MPFKLTSVERQILWNQLELLKAAYPDNKHDYQKQQDILENGYVARYDDVLHAVRLDELSPDDTRFVEDVLDMFSALQRFEQDGGKVTDRYWIDFKGFDGNNEPELMSYTRFLVEREERWEYLGIKNFNSHSRMRDLYERMLDVWHAIDSAKRHSLTAEQVEAVLAAVNHPGP